MKKSLISFLFVITSLAAGYPQSVYVDCFKGSDSNNGSVNTPVQTIAKAADIIRSGDNDIYKMKIYPGVYVLDKHVRVSTEKNMTGKRIVVEAAVMPDDSAWSPAMMPVITSTAGRGEIAEKPVFIVAFLVDESHVTVRGLKFTGYFNPNSRYYPVCRLNKAKTDLVVERCLFMGETESSPIQVGVIAHGNGVKIDHCVFYKVRNSAVFFEPAEENGIKHGNMLTNSIIYGVNQAVWTSFPDSDFKFENNIVSNCRYVWVKNDFNNSSYSIKNCIIVNNKFFTGVPDNAPGPLSPDQKLQLRLRPGKFDIKEENVIKDGKVLLRLADDDDNPLLFGIDEPLPKDYLHVIPGSLGYGMQQTAGLFGGSYSAE